MEALSAALRPGGVLLLAEPKGHVSGRLREYLFELPLRAGLHARELAPQGRKDAAVFEKATHPGSGS